MAAVCLDCFESLKNQFVEVSSHNSSKLHLVVVVEGVAGRFTSRGNLKCTKTSVRPKHRLVFETLFLHFKLDRIIP